MFGKQRDNGFTASEKYQAINTILEIARFVFVFMPQILTPPPMIFEAFLTHRVISQNLSYYAKK